MALFLWQHGEEALARATVACKIYRSMAFEARQSSLDDNIAERLKTYSLWVYMCYSVCGSKQMGTIVTQERIGVASFKDTVIFKLCSSLVLWGMSLRIKRSFNLFGSNRNFDSVFCFVFAGTCGILIYIQSGSKNRHTPVKMASFVINHFRTFTTFILKLQPKIKKMNHLGNNYEQ